jgi:calmodulin
VAGNGLIDEAEFLQWVSRIQAVSQDTSTDDADDITKDLIAAFRVFDRDCNGYITKVQYSVLMLSLVTLNPDVLIPGQLYPEDGDSRFQ